jgi:hypothetical protein
MFIPGEEIFRTNDLVEVFQAKARIYEPRFGVAAMCRHVMAIFDVQVVSTSLPTIWSAFAVPPDQMSRAYPIIAIPLTGILTRLLSTRRSYRVSSIASRSVSTKLSC